MNRAAFQPARADSDFEAARRDLLDAVAILDAIEFGELLAARPAASEERARHIAGVVLLGVLQQRLQTALQRL